MNIIPFKGLRPQNQYLQEIIAPPYDVIDSESARIFAKNKPHNFLHVSKPEIDFDENVNPYQAKIYQKAHDNFADLCKQGIIKQDETASFYLYRLTQNNHQQTGIVTGVSCQAYRDGFVKIHEHTREVKEQDRMKHLKAVGAHTGPVILTFHHQAALEKLVAELTANAPEVDVTAEDGVRHQLWVIAKEETVKQLNDLLAKLPALYVADGHHRSAAASKLLTDKNQHFLAVLFPQAELQTLGYHRIIKDLNGLTPDELLAKLAQHFDIAKSANPVMPAKIKHYGMLLDNLWYQLKLKNTVKIPNDPIAQLDVTQLTELILTPIFNITDMRNDPRIDYIGGAGCEKIIEQKMHAGEIAISFTLAPTPVNQIMQIADNNGIMPPKSTWFEPKLADGLIFLKIAC